MLRNNKDDGHMFKSKLNAFTAHARLNKEAGTTQTQVNAKKCARIKLP